MTNIIRTKALIVLPNGAKIFSELCTEISIEDDAGGEFVIVSQCGDIGTGKIAIEPNEWPVLREAIDRMIGECAKDAK